MAKNQKVWTKQEDLLLSEHYSTQKKEFIMSLFNNERSWPSIGKHANYLHLPRRMIATNNGVNLHFFDTWSEQMAYVLGFIAADGCVSDNGMVQINLSYKDHQHNEKLRDLIYPGKPIVKYISPEGYEHSMFNFGSKYMAQRLMELGITPRKSLTLKFPCVPSEYLRHFVRGYFDGDGCVMKNVFGIDIIGSLDFITGLSGVLSGCLDINKPVVHKKKNANAYNIKLSTKPAMIVLGWMYDDSSIYLDRKYNLYLEKRRHWTNYRTEWTPKEDLILANNYGKINVRDICAKLNNRTIYSIYHRAERLGIGGR